MNKRRRRPLKLPDPRLPLRTLVETLPGLVWLAVLGLAAWFCGPVGPAERAVDAMEREAGR
jgi:hypothetical protein